MRETHFYEELFIVELNYFLSSQIVWGTHFFVVGQLMFGAQWGIFLLAHAHLSTIVTVKYEYILEYRHTVFYISKSGL